MSAYLILLMFGTDANPADCEAVALCDERQHSCEAVIVSCDRPVSIDECLGGIGYRVNTAGELQGQGFDVLGCAVSEGASWPAFVDVDQKEISK